MFKHAFDCKRYDGQTPCDCPAWWQWVETDGSQERISQDCGWKAMPRFLIEVVKASNRPAAAIESTRNEIANGFVALTRALPRGEE